MDEKLIYYVLAAKYMKKHNIKEEFELFPYDIFYGDTKTKIEILVEALNNNVKVEEVEKYLQHTEGYSDGPIINKEDTLN
ncbi:MAG: hypothetical protein J6X02_05600 [Bacilli bacterium]|nr:hypothetical protein [Bacilli bacterium]